MKLKATIELELEVSDFYSREDAIIMTKNEISDTLKGLCVPESVKFVKNFVDVKDTNKK